MAIPGYMDLQVNGFVGVDFSSTELTEDNFLQAAEKLLKSGTYAFLPTIITSSMELYKRNIGIISNAISKVGLKEHVPGFHLEGPFISRKPGAVGAHNPEYVQNSDKTVLDQLIEFSGNSIKLLTVAAESPGVCDFIKYATSRGITVSLGHQNAGKSAIKSAAKAGASLLTHLGNGLPNMLPRHDNPIWNSLACDELTPMLITDGHHLPAKFIKCVVKMKGAENIIVVSDMSSAAGLPPRRYHVLGNDAVLEPNGKLHNPEKQCLVGSGSTMKQCMEFLASLEILTEAELELVGYYNPMRLIA